MSLLGKGRAGNEGRVVRKVVYEGRVVWRRGVGACISAAWARSIWSIALRSFWDGELEMALKNRWYWETSTFADFAGGRIQMSEENDFH